MAAVVPTLYDQATDGVTVNYSLLRNEVRQLPVHVVLDLYHNLCNYGQLCQLSLELSDFDTFIRTLTYCHGKRHIVFECFQALMDHGSKTSQLLAKTYVQRSHGKKQSLEAYDFAKTGMMVATFFCESGWYQEAQQILCAALELCQNRKSSVDPSSECFEVLSFDLSTKLLSAYNCFCRFDDANRLYEELRVRIEKNSASPTKSLPLNVPLAMVEFSCLFWWQSQYDESYKWSMRALNNLNSKSPVLTVIDVLRQAAKSCVVKRSFKRAEMLIKQALVYADKKIAKLQAHWHQDMSQLHPKIAELFSDFGFYLLNVDLIGQSVKFYEMALHVRNKLFAGQGRADQESGNLLVAMAYEDLAYSTYVYEYSSGRFDGARILAERAMKVMSRLLPNDHLLLASAKRIKALILEEIAIDHHDKVEENNMLKQSETLHLSALELAKKAFGVTNVQTAKHYGNLGRLYQSMHKYDAAEEMHLRAIKIKEELLGPDDFEVALSLGHLASLYNYDMLQFEKAEELYLRSIKIGVKLFGEAYSGLEYDYRGLLRVYLNLSNHPKTIEYMQVIHHWKHLRDDFNSEMEDDYILTSLDTIDLCDISDIMTVFHSIAAN